MRACLLTSFLAFKIFYRKVLISSALLLHNPFPLVSEHTGLTPIRQLLIIIAYYYIPVVIHPDT